MNFTEWLQTRLNAHGAKITVDGDWGRESIAALRAFQAKRGLPVTGVADKASIDALKRHASDGDNRIMPVPVTASVGAMPPWMAEMHRRMGLHEINDTEPLIDWLKIGRFLGNPRNLPWCGDAVETAIVKTLPDEIVPSNPFFAQNWKDFGVECGFIVGAIGVIKWSPNAGHVGIVAGLDGSDRINLLGGNQQNAINIASFPRKAFIASRWPKTFPIQNYPPLQGSGGRADLGSTR
jgi:uncharacterized protein (TIGR02594 family)